MTFTCFFAYLLLKVIKGVNFIDFSSAIFWVWNVLLTQISYATGTRRLFIYFFYIFWYQKYAALGSCSYNYVFFFFSLFFLSFFFVWTLFWYFSPSSFFPLSTSLQRISLVASLAGGEWLWICKSHFITTFSLCVTKFQWFKQM